MNDSDASMINEESTSATPVSPVQIDLSVLRKPLFSLSDRLRFVAIAALCLGLHVVLLLMLDPPPEVTQVEEAIPVEVIVEPAPEEAAPQPEPEKAEEKKEEEKKEEETPPEQQAQTLKEKE